MLELEKVLVVIDPDRETQLALDKALHLEKLCEFEMKLIACDYSQYLVEGYYFDAVQIPQLRKDYLAERRAALRALTKPLRDSGLCVQTDALWGHPPFESIVLETLNYKPDLVVHSTRRHSKLSRMFLSNEDWQLVRTCPSPLWLVKEKKWNARPVMLAAVDPKHARGKPVGLDHKIVRYAEQLADCIDAELHVMHSFSQIPLSGTYPAQALEEHQTAFTQLMADFDIPEERQHLVAQAPDYALQDLEKKLDVDIIVMGAISRSRLTDAFIGNTAEKVLDYLESDVLIIKPDSFVSPIKSSS
jgi:universal stress protein E